MSFKWPLFNLFVIAFVGMLLRLAFVVELPWLEYSNFLHAHSHLAVLGWGFLGLVVLLLHSFLPQERRNAYRKLFYGALFSLWGMFLAFLWQNYGLFSIGFSVLFLFWSYGLVWLFWQDISFLGRGRISLLFLRTALFFYLFSTLGLWALALINASGLQGSPVYYMAIQFFLHFQFNGWFLFAVPALFFELLEEHDIKLSPRKLRAYWLLLLLSCFLTYALAVTWTTPLPFIFWTNSLGVVLQLGALYFLLTALHGHVRRIKLLFPHVMRVLFSVALTSYVLKIVIQAVVVIPYVATIAYTVRNYVIGFIHLILLGVLTSFLFSLAGFRQMIPLDKRSVYWGIRLFVPAFVFTEVLLFLQGSMFWAAWGFFPFFYELMFLFSLLLPLSIGMILWSLFRSEGFWRN